MSVFNSIDKNYLECDPNKLPKQRDIYQTCWFNPRNFLTFGKHPEEHVQHWLEIGAHEGRSTNYFLDHILKHKDSKITVIDPWINYSESTIEKISNFDNHYKDIYNRFLKCTEPNKDKIIIKRGLSQDILPSLTDKFDFILIDGDHSEKAVWNDAVYSFKLLKIKGRIIFDDYKWRAGGTYPIGGPWGPKSPKNAIDRFLNEYKSQINILGFDIHNQVIIEKISE
tara:strand:- start:277 stop:951 length:675 start_codon:yes stop_codon:yes gene_type:complete